MFSFSFRPVLLTGLSLVLTVAGCSSGLELPDTVDVSGKVTYNGEPVTNAEVGFIPKQEVGTALSARGRTNDAGEYTLETYVNADNRLTGATPGDYTVTVQKTDVPADPAEMQKQFLANPGMVPKALLPAKYSKPGETDLTATVTKDGENKINFELNDE